METLIRFVPGATLIFVALVSIAVSVPLYKGQVKMNKWYGVRTAKSFSSDENWYAVNKYGARQLMRWSVPELVSGIALTFLPFGVATVVAMIVVLQACLVIPLVQVYRFGKRLPDGPVDDSEPRSCDTGR